MATFIFGGNDKRQSIAMTAPVQETLDVEKNEEQIKKSGEGMGKSGAFMFFSKDERLLLKTMTTEDFNAWMSMFKSYFDHVNSFKL